MGLSVRLAELGLTLPPSPKALGAYLPARRVGDLVYVAGQLPMLDGKLLATGPVPSVCPPELAERAACQCVLNGLAAAASVLASIDRITGVVRVGAFVQSDDRFAQQPTIANAASNLLVELLGEPGKHVRAAVGTNALPLDASVEIEFVFAVS